MKYSYYVKNNRYHKVNLGIIVLFVLSCIFAFRICIVLKNNSERGAYAYVQVINYEMPIVKSHAYNKEDFIESKISIKSVCAKALGLDKINTFKIIRAEAACINIKDYKQTDFISSNDDVCFQLSEDSIIRTDKNNTIDDSRLKKPLDQTKPEVLIYHTHTIESYSEDGPDSLNENNNVVAVGNVIEDELENKYGIATIHDKTNHCTSYIQSYQRSNETVKRYLDKYGDFKLIIDIHRDSSKNKSVTTISIDGKNAVKVMFVNAKNSTRYSKNKQVADFFKSRMDQLYPGMCRGILTYNSGKNAFNQSLSDNSMLMEFGSNVNSVEEAKTSAKYVSRVIAEYINGSDR